METAVVSSVAEVLQSIIMTHKFRLKEWREKKDLTQEELAQKSKVNRVTIARLEGGAYDPRFQTLIQLAEALDIKVTQLLPKES